MVEKPHALTGKRWVHVDGDDTEAGAVYHNAEANVAPSRRPKEYLEFADDGTVKKLATGADDRAHEVESARWSKDDPTAAFKFASADARGATSYHVVEQGDDRIVVHRS
ncbi:MAG: hypothetical protein ABJC26_14945 [Gemmatimonadaceae bacterium]